MEVEKKEIKFTDDSAMLISELDPSKRYIVEIHYDNYTSNEDILKHWNLISSCFEDKDITAVCIPVKNGVPLIQVKIYDEGEKKHGRKGIS